jgi:Ca2+-binding EF-hand superfamily protein
MKNISALGLTVCIAALTTFAFAQPDDPSDASGPSSKGLHHDRSGPHPADANDDGVVTSDEFKQFQHEAFSKSDVNKDGQLDREEVLSIREHLHGRKGQIPPAPGPEWRSGREDRRHRGHRDPEHIFSTFDENEDGALQENEVPEGMAEHFGRLDADGNGAITLEEFKQGRPDPEQMKARFQERFKAMDKNNDGMIQADEAEGPMQKHFDRMDANGDGRIDADELKALRDKFRSRSGEDRRRHHSRRGQPETGDDAPESRPSDTPES